ncbi:MAG: IS110 family transposase [Nitrososphaerota archaeon]|nr:IS110 family transposase [Nitrososphaerota archaeon]
MLDRLKFNEDRCEPFEDRIRALVRDNDDVRLLMTIPGVDFYLAALICSYIRDVNRFPSFDHLASFFGIIPESRDSANVRRRGKMSKDGPSIPRWALGVMVDTHASDQDTPRLLHARKGQDKERKLRPCPCNEEAPEDGLPHPED